MIEGRFDSELIPRIPITLVGVNGIEIDIDAAIDTGLTLSMSLPLAKIEELGWIYHSHEEVEYGDNVARPTPLYHGLVRWQNEFRFVTVMASDFKPLVGTRLLEGAEVVLHCRLGGIVRITPLP